MAWGMIRSTHDGNIIGEMRHAWLVAVLALRCSGYELTGRIEPPAAVSVLLHGATAPFESSTVSGEDGRFRFRKLSAGTYTVALSTAARGEARQTIELSPGTVDSKGRLDIVLRIDDSRLESDGVRANGATVSATVLSIPDRAMREYKEAQRCLSRSESTCASAHLRRAVEIAPRFAAAWNQLGTIAYQTQRYSDAEANFRTALDVDHEAFKPLVNLGGVLLNLGRPQEAIAYNQRAVARRPNDALANSQLGLSYFELNDLDLAGKYLEIAVQLDHAHFSHPQLALAEIYIRRGDRSSALRALYGFLEQHPDSP
jgi:tetratricopeptide (TPR) repeat protein